jgi:hypothetical protein
MRSSLVMPLVDAFNPHFLADRWRHYIDAAFECAHDGAAGSDGEKRFILAHVPAPHLPIVYRHDGQPAPLRYYSDTRQELEISDSEFSAAYMGHLKYVNVKTLEVVDAMIAADSDSVVILMSDHGSEIGLNWLSWAASDLEERFAILFAARTPGEPCLFGNSPTAVNVFGTLLSAYFERPAGQLPDSQFVSDATSPFDLHVLPHEDQTDTGCPGENTDA